MSKLRDAVLLLAVLAIVGTAAVVGLHLWHDGTFDITVYLAAADRMRTGSELYDPAPYRELAGPYLYPPLLAVLLAPLTALPGGVAYAVWAALQLAFLGAAYEAVRRMSGAHERGRDFAFLLVLPLAAAVFDNVQVGQLNLIVLTVVAGGLAAIAGGRALAGGALLGFAAHLKVLPIVLLGVLVVQRRWRAVGGFVTALVVLLAAPWVWTGPGDGLDPQVRWVEQMLAPTLEDGEVVRNSPVRVPNHSLPAFSGRLFADGEWISRPLDLRSPLLFALPPRVPARLGFLAALCLYLVALFAAMRTRDDPSPEALVVPAALAMIAAMLGNALCWTHHLVLLALGLGPLFARLLDRGSRRAAGRTAGLLFLLFFPAAIHHPGGYWQAAWGTPTLGVLVAFALIYREFVRR